MARDFFNNLPNTTTPLTAPRLNGLLDGDEAMGNIVVDSITSKNILNMSATTQTINGINYTINDDGTITANGTASSTSILFIKEYPYHLSAGQFMLSGCPTGGSSSTYKLDLLDSSGNILSADYGNGAAINLSNNLTSRGVRIVIYSGVNANNLKFKPMIEKGTTATNYAPYQNLTAKEIYSTPEKKVGTWINGKPIYRKIIPNITINLTNNVQDIPHSISNFEDLVDLKIKAKYRGTTYDLLSSGYIVRVDSSNIDIDKMTQGIGLNSYVATIIIEYTKTTD